MNLYPPHFFRKVLLATFFVFIFYGLYNYNSTIRPINPEKNKNLCWNNIDFKRYEKYLLTKTPLSKLVIPNTENVFILNFSNGLKTIFKPNRTNFELASSLRAYHFSQILNLKLIPPTVIRKIDGEIGIISLFINSTDLDFLTVKGANYRLNDIKKKIRVKIYIFNFLLGGWDSFPNNTIVQKNDCLSLIDNDENLDETVIHNGYVFFGFQKQINSDLDFLSFKSIQFEREASIKINNTNLSKKFVNLNSKALDYLKATYYNEQLFYINTENTLWVKDFNIEENYKITEQEILEYLQFDKKLYKKLENLSLDDLQYFIKNNTSWLDKKTKDKVKTQNKILLFKRDNLLKKVQFKK